MSTREEKNAIKFFVGLTVGITIFLAIVSIFFSKEDIKDTKSLSLLMENIDIKDESGKQAAVETTTCSLKNNMPSIDEYPLSVEGNGDINIELCVGFDESFAGDCDWIIEAVNSFNDSNTQGVGGKSVSISLRALPNELAAYLIASNEYSPDAYMPKSSLWGDYVSDLSGNITLVSEKTIANQSGFMLPKSSICEDLDDVVKSVIRGRLSICMGSPYVNTNGLNLIVSMSKDSRISGKMNDFLGQVELITYDSSQMNSAINNGLAKGYLTDYLTYKSNSVFSDKYKFVAIGQNLDNPLYIVKDNNLSSEKKEVVSSFAAFLSDSDKLSDLIEYGPDFDEDYSNYYNTYSGEIIKVLESYKVSRSNTKKIISLFLIQEAAIDSHLVRAFTDNINFADENTSIGLMTYDTGLYKKVAPASFDLETKSYFMGALEDGKDTSGGNVYSAIVGGLDLLTKVKTDSENVQLNLCIISKDNTVGRYDFETIHKALADSGVVVYSIAYDNIISKENMKGISDYTNGAFIDATKENIDYYIGSILNSQF